MRKRITAASLQQAMWLSERELDRIRQLRTSASISTNAMVTDFYDWLADQKELMENFPNGFHASLGNKLVAHWDLFLSARVNKAYLESRAKLGAIHATMDIPIWQVVAGINFVQGWLLTAVRQSALPDQAKADTTVAMMRLIQLDIALISQGYASSVRTINQGERDTYRNILDATQESIITIDPKGIMVMVTRGTEKMFGWHRSEMVGNNVKMLMPNPYQAGHDGYLADHTTHGTSRIMGVPRDFKAVRKNGEQFDCRIAINTMADARSGKKLYVGVVQDITHEIQRNLAADRRTQNLETAGWYAGTKADTAAAMRGNQTVEELADSVLSVMCKTVAASSGTLYLIAGSNKMQLSAVHNYERRGHIPHTLSLDDGHVGQAARSHERVILDRVPADFLGQSRAIDRPPVAILAFPFSIGARVIGVVELASRSPFDSRHLDLLDQLSEPVAFGFVAAQGRQVARQQLEESRRHSGKLQAEQTALRAANKALRGTGKHETNK